MAAVEQIQARAFWPIHIDQWRASGQSQAAYCRQHDLCPQKFSYWKRKSSVKPAGSPGFARIRVDADLSSAPSGGLSLRFNDGMRLEGITQNTMPCIQPLLELLR